MRTSRSLPLLAISAVIATRRRRVTAGALALAALLALISAPAWAQTNSGAWTCTPTAGGVLDQVSQQFSSATSGWMTSAQRYAQHIFLGLAGLELAWAGAHYTLHKHDLSELTVSVLFKVIALAFFFMLIGQAPTWMPAILSSFTQIGQGIGGGASLPTVAAGMISPSAVMDVGICSAKSILELPAPAGLLAAILPALMAALTAFFIVIGFCLVALQLLMTQVESYLVIGAGAVLLGFLGSRWTANWGEKVFAYAVSVGVKLMVIYLIVGLGQTLVATNFPALLQAAAQDASASGSGVPARDYLVFVVVALIYGGLAWNIPGIAGTFLNGSPHTSLGSMATPMIGMGVAAAAVGAAALSTVSSAGAGLAKLAGLGQGGGGNAPGANTDALASLSAKAQPQPQPQSQTRPSQPSQSSQSNASPLTPSASAFPLEAAMPSSAGPAHSDPSKADDTTRIPDAETPTVNPADESSPQTSAQSSAQSSDQASDQPRDTENALGDGRPNARAQDTGKDTESAAGKALGWAASSARVASRQAQDTLAHLKAHDGTVGSVSIRLNHPE